MAKFLDKCPNCGDIFTNYNEQPTKYCSVSCQLASPIIDTSVEEVKSAKDGK